MESVYVQSLDTLVYTSVKIHGTLSEDVLLSPQGQWEYRLSTLPLFTQSIIKVCSSLSVRGFSVYTLYAHLASSVLQEADITKNYNDAAYQKVNKMLTSFFTVR
jgi:hypothetical protein